jgi:hypothetical protein
MHSVILCDEYWKGKRTHQTERRNLVKPPS